MYLQYFIVIPVVFLITFFLSYISKLSFKNIQENIREEFKLNLQKGGFLTNPSLYGNIDGKEIKITRETVNKKNYLNIDIYHNININGEFNITKESFFTKLKGSAGFSDIKTYHEKFDDKMLLSAKPEINLIALLNLKVTNDILTVYEHASQFEITKHGIHIKLSMDMFSSQAEQAVYVIKNALSISRNMCGEKSIKERLIENIKNETNNIVRLNNLYYLTDKYPEDEEVRTYLKSLFKDSDEDIQVAAAKQAGNEGLEHLFKLLKKQAKDKYIYNPDIIAIFGQKKFLRSLPVILDIYKGADEIHQKSVILTALKDFADTSASGLLVKELNNKDQKLRDEAISALSTCGNREAVEPLFKLNKTIINPSVKNLIQEAISRIQSRLGPVDMGALSIAEFAEKDGALSISADAEAGGLSIAENEDKEKKISLEGGV